MKTQKNNQIFKPILIVVLIAVGIVSIGYAYLSTTLTLTYNKITQTSLTWDIHFKAETVSPTEYGTSATGRTCPQVTVTAGDTITIPEVTLSKPGDGCSWKFTILNTGGIDAVLNSITPTKPATTCTQGSDNNTITCNNIIYKLGTNAGCSNLFTVAGSGTLAKTSGSKNVYVCVYYDEAATALSSTLPTSLNNAQFKFNYTQQ